MSILPDFVNPFQSILVAFLHRCCKAECTCLNPVTTTYVSAATKQIIKVLRVADVVLSLQGLFFYRST
ncbi:hypothetical protein CLDAP_12300 [Caldilinea aerophila DSM 14535 = NBRC 104270]|uniref:Uncharacterized protein n=1 Tax=Caldilinea aerophila (strain DSM 14535 / JCM 11387 / NBRC 104270 / STL-6-O1) TaxID=926550 RepID=I0I1Y2_CALAS|nr:hypothetical protein CLDAP_12300 [Caldilinea aerophila DSM 14535 = NBRC 104270]